MNTKINEVKVIANVNEKENEIEEKITLLQHEINKVQLYLHTNEGAFTPFSFDFTPIIEYIKGDMKKEFPLSYKESTLEELLLGFKESIELGLMEILFTKFGYRIGSLEHPIPLTNFLLNSENIIELNYKKEKINIDSTLYNFLNEFYTSYGIFKFHNGNLLSEYIYKFLEENPNLKGELIEELRYIIDDLGQAVYNYSYDMVTIYNFLTNYNCLLLTLFKDKMRFSEEDLVEIEREKLLKKKRARLEVDNVSLKYKISSEDMETLKKAFANL